MSSRYSEKVLRDRIVVHAGGTPVIWGFPGIQKPDGNYVSLQYITTPWARIIDLRRELPIGSQLTVSVPANTDSVGLTVNGVPIEVPGIVGDANQTAANLAARIAGFLPNLTVVHTAPSAVIDLSGALFSATSASGLAIVNTPEARHADVAILETTAQIQMVAASPTTSVEASGLMHRITQGLISDRRLIRNLGRVDWSPIQQPFYTPIQTGTDQWLYRSTADTILRYTDIIRGDSEQLGALGLTFNVS